MQYFNPKNYSFTTRALVVFFLIVLVLIAIRSLLIQPKILNKNLNDEIEFISSKILTIKDIYSSLKKENIDDIIKVSLLKNSDLKTSKIEIFHSKGIKKQFEFKEEKIENETRLSWIVKLKNIDKEENVFLKYTIDKKEIENKVNVGLFFLLPETTIAIFVSFILLIFIFRRMLSSIDNLTMKLTKSLEEKEILLKEIHHRVKNNLALTISLIELQEEEIEDINTKKVLKNIQERIYAMELLHRKLYESTNLDKINFKNYITDLVNTIKHSYDFNENLQIKFNIEDINLNLEDSVPYGLILNELLTNSFKYAFKNNQNPKLTIQMSKKDENKILLIVQDNGKGLEKDFNELSNETLGLKLVNMIIRFQLQGSFEYEYKDGARFIIKTINSNT